MLENKSVPSDLTGGIQMKNYNPVNYESQCIRINQMDINDFDGAANNGFYNFSRKLIPWKNMTNAGLKDQNPAFRRFVKFYVNHKI